MHERTDRWTDRRDVGNSTKDSNIWSDISPISIIIFWKFLEKKSRYILQLWAQKLVLFDLGFKDSFLYCEFKKLEFKSSFFTLGSKFRGSKIHFWLGVQKLRVQKCGVQKFIFDFGFKSYGFKNAEFKNAEFKNSFFTLGSKVTGSKMQSSKMRSSKIHSWPWVQKLRVQKCGVQKFILN